MLAPLRKIIEQPAPQKKKRVYREASVQAEVVKWARDRGWLVVKMHNEQKRKYGASRDIALGLKPGIPDLWLDFKGYDCWLELKAGKGKLSEDQIQTHKELRSRGKTVFIAWSFEEARKRLEGHEMIVEVFFREQYLRRLRENNNTDWSEETEAEKGDGLCLCGLSVDHTGHCITNEKLDTP